LDLLEPSEEFTALQKKHPNFKYIQTDVTKESSIEHAIEAIVDAEGAIHGMIANAGMTKHQPALDFSREQLDQLFNLNAGLSHGFGTFFKLKYPVIGLRSFLLCSNRRTQIHCPWNQGQYRFHSFHDLLPTESRRSFCTVWRYQSCGSQYGSYVGDGVGETWD